MRQIGTATPQPGREVATQPSQRKSALVVGSVMPPVVNRITDLVIPNAVFSSWTETGKARQIRRALTIDERHLLENRRDEVAPALMPFSDKAVDPVVEALLDMYGGYRNMRGGEDDAAARVDAAARLLAEFPAWAIQKACMAIRRNGVWREGKFDRVWPPNDAEIIAAVKDEMRLYQDTFDRCVALLTATVEER